MLVDGLLLGSLTLGAVVLTYKHLPEWAKKFVHNHPLLTRGVLILSTYILLGHTLTALFAAAILDILLSVLLSICADPQAFAGLRALLEKLKALRQKIVATIVSALGQPSTSESRDNVVTLQAA